MRTNAMSKTIEESFVAIQLVVLDALGADFEKAGRGIVDFLQIKERGTRKHDFRAMPEKYRALGSQYIKDYVSLNQFAA